MRLWRFGRARGFYRANTILESGALLATDPIPRLLETLLESDLSNYPMTGRALGSHPRLAEVVQRAEFDSLSDSVVQRHDS